jgi:hypothetical protein
MFVVTTGSAGFGTKNECYDKPSSAFIVTRGASKMLGVSHMHIMSEP